MAQSILIRIRTIPPARCSSATLMLRRPGNANCDDRSRSHTAAARTGCRECCRSMAQERRAGEALVRRTDQAINAGAAARLLAAVGPIDNAGMEGSAEMSESNKSPTDASTRPLGNSEPRPTPLARGGIGPHARAKMREINPDATRAL